VVLRAYDLYKKASSNDTNLTRIVTIIKQFVKCK